MEPFANPTKAQVKKARELYGDPLLHWAVNSTIRHLNKLADEQKEWTKDIVNINFNSWKRDTRLLMKHIPVGFLFQTMEDLVYNIAKEDFKFPTEKELKKQSIKDIKVSSRIKIFKKKISITSLAELYGIEVKRNMACCPFHDDKIPSLSFSNQKGVFNCFGCGTKGDMITFVQKMEELKDGKKTS